MAGGFGKQGGSSVAAMRAQLQAGSGKFVRDNGNPPPPPPKKRKHVEPEDPRDRLAEKAERTSQAQHQTSLLTSEPRNSRMQTMAAPKKKGIPFILQLLAVLVVAGGVAFALDPGLMAQVQPYLDMVEPQIQSLRDMVGL
jgi:hypothetical protein